MLSKISEQVFNLSTRQPDMISDEELLTPDDIIVKIRRDVIDNCQTKKRTCTHCTCGRADIDIATSRIPSIAAIRIDLTDGDDIPISGCGSCSKGDAFRCLSCPFLGKPIWHEGIDGKIKLNI